VEICTVGSVRGEGVGAAMVNLNGHEAGNGGNSQGTPTAHRPLSYSERYAVNQDFRTDTHSYLRAMSGSTELARRSGMTAAIAATPRMMPIESSNEIMESGSIP
jgi:hypothetical protein